MRAKRYNQVILFLIYQIYSPKFIFSKGLTSIASNVDRQTCHRFSELRSFNLFPGLSQDQGRKHLLMMLVLRFFNKRSSGSSPTLVFFHPNCSLSLYLQPVFCFKDLGRLNSFWLVFGIAELSRHLRISHVIESAFDKSSMVQLGSSTYPSYAAYRADTHSLLVYQIFLIFS